MGFPRRLILAAILLIAGCRTTYVEDTAPARHAFAEGRFEEAYRAFAEARPAQRDRLCFVLERAVVAHTTGDWDRGGADLEEARKIIGIEEETGALRKSAETAASFLIDETVVPYRGEDFEKVLVPALKTVNGLMRLEPGDVASLDRCYNTARAAAELQKWLAADHERELAEANRQAQDHHARTGDAMDRLRPFYEDQYRSLRSRANLYQNAFAHYLTSMVLEMEGKSDSALIAAEKAYALDPGFSFLKADLLRLSAAEKDRARVEKYRALFGQEPRSLAKDEGEVVLVYECGLSPVKEEVAIRLPIPVRDRLVWVKLAFPHYVSRFNPAAFAVLNVGGGEVRTEPLFDVEAVAILGLRDRLPVLVAKAMVRAALKAAGQLGLQHGGRRAGGDLGEVLGLLAGIFLTEISERADLRSWLTLPQTFQLARIPVKAGRRPFTLRVCDAGGGSIVEIPLGDWEVRPGARRFVLLRSVGPRGFAVVGRYASERTGAN